MSSDDDDASDGERTSEEQDTSTPAENAKADQDARSIPRWIGNDGLLRDEGTLYGLAGLPEQELKSKVETIRKAYSGLLSDKEDAYTSIDEKMERLGERRNEIQEDLEALEDETFEADLPPVDGSEDVTPNTFLRYLVGVVAAGSICAFTFFLIYEQFASEFEHAMLISLSVTLAGFFVVFDPVSLFYTSAPDRGGAPENWKTYVVEFSVPLAASSFVALWRYDALSVPRTLGLWLFLTVVFLLGGKLFLSAIPRTATLFHMARRRWRLKRMERQHKKERKGRSESLQKKLDQLDEEKEALESERDELESPAALEKLRERKVQLFLSEYELVRRAIENGVISPDDVRTETQS